MEIYKIGTKVVPHTKSIYSKLEECKEWRIGQEQGFLYVVDVDEYKGTYTLSAYMNHIKCGNVYNFGDVKPYRESCKLWEDLEYQILLKGKFVVELEWNSKKMFDKYTKEKDDTVICFSNMDENFVAGVTLKEVKMLNKYLSKVIKYVETIREEDEL